MRVFSPAPVLLTILGAAAPWVAKGEVRGRARESRPAPIPQPRIYNITNSVAAQPLTRVIRISDPALEPLARVLASELQQITGHRFRMEPGRAGPGDIGIEINASMGDADANISNLDRVRILGKNYEQCARLSAYLLSFAGDVAGEGSRFPGFKCSLPDRPQYSGLMIDVARKYHSVDSLKQIIQLCRLYQVQYLQLHLTDDQAFTFPSAAFPQLTSQNQHDGRAYTAEELRELEQYARDRAVILVPELEVPGHAAAMVRTMPSLFKIAGTKPYDHHATINFVRDDVVKALDTLVGEISDIFKSSPWFHIGGDEADIALADQHSDFQKAMKDHGLPEKSQSELYRYFINQMNSIVKKHGKKTIVWEGFRRERDSKFKIDKDIIVMVYESAYYLPEELVADGYRVINAAWTPLYVVNQHAWDKSKILEWNPYLWGTFSEKYNKTTWHQLKPSAAILGAQMCSWEQPEAAEIESLRARVPAMMERLCTQSARKAPDYDNAFGKSDEALGRLLNITVSARATGLKVSSPEEFASLQFLESATIELKFHSQPALQIKESQVRICYTLDGSRPNALSPEYKAPIIIHRTTTVRAVAVGPENQLIGAPFENVYYKSDHK